MSKERTATFQDFLDGKISVEFTWDKPAEVDEFLKLCEAKRLKWRNGCQASRFKPVRMGEPLTYRILFKNDALGWGSSFVNLPAVPYRLLKMHDNYEIHIACNDGKITHAIYKKNGETVQRSFAFRNPDDEFDFAKGVMIAMERLDDFQEALAKPEKPDEPLWARVKEGDKVMFKHHLKSIWNEEMYETADEVFTVAKIICRNSGFHGLLSVLENPWCYLTDDVVKIL